MNYEELVKALRWCDASFLHECGNCLYVKYKHCKDDCIDRMLRDAAAAIEDLQAQLPKRGEWLPYEFNTNGTWHKCSVCGVAYQYKDAPNSGWWINHNYCPNCGAKMEVQDG